MIYEDFLHSCGCLVLHCFLEASSIHSSMSLETNEVQRLIMKVGSINVCLLSCQFITLMKLVNIVHFSKEKSCV